MPNVSVCMATYNGGKYIKKQIDSILSQLGSEDELIISDDSSNDDTLDIIQGFNDKRIILLPNQKFRNPIFNFENAINHSNNDFIFLSDQDDLWNENKVVRMLEVLDTFDMVVSDCSIIDEQDKIKIDSFFYTNGISSGIIGNLIKNSYIGCCMAFNRKILKRALPFPKDIPMHDIWLGFVAELYFKTYFVKEKLTYYREHSNNASSASKLESPFTLFEKLKFRVNLLKYIPKLLFR